MGSLARLLKLQWEQAGGARCSLCGVEADTLVSDLELIWIWVWNVLGVFHLCCLGNIAEAVMGTVQECSSVCHTGATLMRWLVLTWA